MKNKFERKKREYSSRMPDHNGKPNGYWTHGEICHEKIDTKQQKNERKTKIIVESRKKGSNRHKINGPHDLSVQAYGTAWHSVSRCGL